MDRLLTLKEVQHLIPLSRSHIYVLMGQGKFPRQVKIGERRVAWWESQIKAYQNGKRDWGVLVQSSAWLPTVSSSEGQSPAFVHGGKTRKSLVRLTMSRTKNRYISYSVSQECARGHIALMPCVPSALARMPRPKTGFEQPYCDHHA